VIVTSSIELVRDDVEVFVTMEYFLFFRAFLPGELGRIGVSKHNSCDFLHCTSPLSISTSIHPCNHLVIVPVRPAQWPFCINTRLPTNCFLFLIESSESNLSPTLSLLFGISLLLLLLVVVVALSIGENDENVELLFTGSSGSNISPTLSILFGISPMLLLLDTAAAIKFLIGFREIDDSGALSENDEAIELSSSEHFLAKDNETQGSGLCAGGFLQEEDSDLLSEQDEAVDVGISCFGYVVSAVASDVRFFFDAVHLDLTLILCLVGDFLEVEDRFFLEYDEPAGEIESSLSSDHSSAMSSQNSSCDEDGDSAGWTRFLLTFLVVVLMLCNLPPDEWSIPLVTK